MVIVASVLFAQASVAFTTISLTSEVALPARSMPRRAPLTKIRASGTASVPGDSPEDVPATEVSVDAASSSIPKSTFNLAKNIMGAGAISLPGSITALGDVKGAIFPALGILIIMGILSACTFSIIGLECERYGASSFEEVWAKTIGEKSIWVISSSVAITTVLACLAYSMIIGDLVSALAVSAGATGLLAKRSASILGVTGAVVAPLCFLKSLASLSFTSLLGVFGVVFSTAVMGLRYFDGSYLAPAAKGAAGGRYFAELSKTMKPAFGTVSGGWKLDHMAFLVLSCLGTAFLAHFNAPTFYANLERRDTKRFNRVVAYGFGTSMLVFAGMMAFGFGTFGAATLGNVFVNYASSDLLATLCRVAIVFSITFT
jgi:amino acid permease